MNPRLLRRQLTRYFATGGLIAIAFSSLGASAPTPPADWRIELVAQAPDIRHPSVVCIAPDGRVFVAEDPMDISTPHADTTEGRIICLHPDGHRTLFADKLHAVFGLQYLEGKVYVLHNPQFTVFTDDNGIGIERIELIESMNPNPWALDWNDHVPANFKLAMDGYFYLAVGDKGVYGAVGRDGVRVDLHGGGILRLRPDGTALEVYCTGVRNILDVALNDEDEIFTYDNTDEHDWMGRLTHMVDGGFYGYPHDFIPRRPYTLWMMHDFGGGAACATLAYTEDALPAEYQNNLFLADFGKRQVLRVHVERKGASWRVASDEGFFREAPDDFRPVGMAWGADGKSFYICDWQHRDTKEKVVVGRLWRAIYTGKTRAASKPTWYLPAAMGKPFNATTVELVHGLSHPSKQVRLQASRALGRGDLREASRIAEVLKDSSAESAARWHALWALDALDGGESARAVILGSANDPDARVRRQTIRQLGQRRVQPAVPTLLAHLKDTDAPVRFQAATALGRIAETNTVPALLAALDESDLFGRFATFTALNRIGRSHPTAWPAIASVLSSDNARVREGAEFALRETYDPALVAELCRIANNERIIHRVPVRAAALRLIIPLMHRPAEWKGEWGAYHPALAPPAPKTNIWPGTTLALLAFTKALGDPAPDLRLLGIEGLRQANNRAATADLFRRQFDNDEDTVVRVALVAALGDFKDAAFSSRLARVLQTEVNEKRIFSASVRAAGQIGGAELNRALVELSSRATLATVQRVELIEMLGALKSREALPALRPLVSAPDRSLRIASQRAIARIGDDAALEILRSLLTNSSLDIRREGIVALGQLHDRRAVPDLLSAWHSAETRESAIGALTDLKDIRALDAYLNGLGDPDANLRTRCRNALAPIHDEARPLIEARLASFSQETLRELRLVYQNDPGARKGILFASTNAPPDLAEYDRYAMAEPGDPVSGQRLFFDENGVACIKCHAVGGHGATVGPDLTLIGVQFPRKDLIEHLLEPSKVVREGYQQWNIETRDGEMYSGLIQSETADALTLVGSDARPQLIAKSAIATRVASTLSLMPAGLEAGLTLRQFADLIAFLESRRFDPRQPKSEKAPDGFTALFNGQTLDRWRELPSGTKRVDSTVLRNGKPPEHWRAANNLLEHDGKTGDLWTEQEFGDFELRLDWRWVDKPQWENFPLISTNSYEIKDGSGQAITARVLDAGDSGVLIRGLYKAQANLFCYPVGSGESWEYRTDLALPESVRRGVTPKRAADRPVGDWNQMRLIVRESRLTVILNGQEVIADAELPGLPERGPIGLQHEHGRIQFHNIFTKDLR